MSARVVIAFVLASVAAAFCGGWVFMSLSALVSDTDPRPFMWLAGGFAGAIFFLAPASFLCAIGVALFGLPIHVFLKRVHMTEVEDYLLASLMVAGGGSMLVFLAGLHQPPLQRIAMPAGIFTGGIAAATAFRLALGFRMRRSRAMRAS